MTHDKTLRAISLKNHMKKIPNDRRMPQVIGPEKCIRPC